MADIFGGVEPPRWLQEITQRNYEHGQWGQLAGTVASGLFNSQQREPVTVTDPKTGETKEVPGAKKGFAQGLFEARMNQQDPLWKLKAAQAQATTASHIASAQATYALTQERLADTKAWMEDAPILSPWLTATPEQRQTMQPPIAKSTKGMDALRQIQTADDRYFLGKTLNDTRTAAAKTAAADAKKFIDDLGTVTDPAERSRIRGMMKDGMPTPEAWNALIAAPKESKEAERQRLMGQRQQDVLEQKHQFAVDMETLKSGNALEKQRVHDQTMKDIAAAKGNVTYSQGDRAYIRVAEDLLKDINKRRIELEASTLSATEKNKHRLALWSEEHDALEQLQAAIEIAEKHASANRATPPVPAAPAPSAGQGVPSTQLQSRDMLPGDDAPHVPPTPLGTTPNPTRFRWEKGVLIPLP